MNKFLTDSCYFCKSSMFISTEYYCEYQERPGIMMDGDFCDSPEWIRVCHDVKCQDTLKEFYEIRKTRNCHTKVEDK